MSKRSSSVAFCTLFLAARAASAAPEPGIPAWVPIYPGAKVTLSGSQQTSTESDLRFKIVTRDPCGRVWRFYNEKLTLAGFTVVLSGHTKEDDCVHEMQTHTPRGERLINLSGGPLITYSAGNPVTNTEYEVEVVQRGRADAGSRSGDSPRDDTTAHGKIPAWMPAYPGTVPQGVSSHHEGAETFTSFRFTSRDDPKRILSWFGENLKQIGFRVSLDVFGTSGALRSDTRDQRRSVKIEVSAAGAQTVGLVEIRDTP